MRDPEWTEITRKEWETLTWKAKTLLSTNSHVATVCDPPIAFLIENTGKKSALQERWLLKVTMEYYGPEGEVPSFKDEYWKYYKSDLLDEAFREKLEVLDEKTLKAMADANEETYRELYRKGIGR